LLRERSLLPFCEPVWTSSRLQVKLQWHDDDCCF
jgi:hypothetical protein